MSKDQNERRFDRVSGRFSCSLRHGDEQHRGFATNLSAGGLFLQTRAKFEPGSKLVLELDWRDGGKLTLTGSVARIQTPHRSTQVVSHPGVGFVVESAPEEYFQLVMGLYDAR